MKIVLIDDHDIILESLGLLLNSLEEVSKVMVFNDPNKALEYCISEDFDVLITDFNMPEMSGIALTLKLRTLKPNVRILMLTVDESYSTIKEAFNAGIKGYIMKKSGKKELREAIITINEGKRYVSDAVFSELIRQNLKEENEENDLQSLSEREIEIVTLIAQELSTKEIAEKLFVSVATVEKHRHNVLRKLSVKNSIGIVKFAINNGLLG